ncbi:dTMP kinase [Paenarthrobacter nicotinovorans]|uniref:dTMP kinase n=1 Tax=Paenarthrobacter nicotinovorans TaxID=29320 RepID=UPI0039A6977A
MVNDFQRGAFIVFEGIDGSGKSTQASLLAKRLSDCRIPVHSTAEPTPGPIGSLIRNSFASRVNFDDRVIAALFVADRLDHITNSNDGMLGLIERGTTVISDRYYLSSMAYHASDVGADWIRSANSINTDLLRPDITIFIDIDPDVSLERIAANRSVPDRFEVRPRLESARSNYLKAFPDACEDGIVQVDGSLGLEALSDEIWRNVLPVLAKRGLVQHAPA